MAGDVSTAAQLVEDLSGNLDDLETSLAPLLRQALSSSTSRLPLLDKAKVYVLTTYAIESLLFSYLRLNGVDAKEHAIFKELTRVKSYFEKIKLAESGPSKPTSTVDKDAAARFIKHGLAGNDRYDQQRAAAKRSAEEMNSTSQWGSANRFEGAAKRIRQQETMIPVVKATEIDDSDEAPAKARSSSDDARRAEKKAAKRERRQRSALAKQSPISDLHEAEQAALPLSSVSTTGLDTSDQSTALAQPDAEDRISRKVHKKKRRKDVP